MRIIKAVEKLVKSHLLNKNLGQLYPSSLFLSNCMYKQNNPVELMFRCMDYELLIPKVTERNVVLSR